MESRPMTRSNEFLQWCRQNFFKCSRSSGMLNWDEGSKIKRLLAIDGKTQRGNGNKNQKAIHIVSAVDDKGVCLGQMRVEEKQTKSRQFPSCWTA